MTAVLIALGWVLAYLYGFWLLYVLVMGFYRAWLAKRLTRVALVLTSPALTAAKKTKWTEYRQALRDIPEQSGFPNNVVWPIKPT